jgi:hypothetical protein
MKAFLVAKLFSVLPVDRKAGFSTIYKFQVRGLPCFDPKYVSFDLLAGQISVHTSQYLLKQLMSKIAESLGLDWLGPVTPVAC